jgi:hypothetical protein
VWGVIIVAGVCGSVVMCIASGWLGARHALKNTPRRIVRRLQSPGDSVQASVSSLNGTWNPAKPLGPANPIREAGRAEYRLDESGIVRLRFQPKSGPERDLTGPIPEQLRHAPPGRRRLRTVLVGALTAYLVIIAAGFSLGYFLSGGSTGSHLAVGGLGAFGGLVFVSVLALVLRVGRSLQSFRRPLARR